MMEACWSQVLFIWVRFSFGGVGGEGSNSDSTQVHLWLHHQPEWSPKHCCVGSRASLCKRCLDNTGVLCDLCNMYATSDVVL
jgi:hypothetical protein